MTQYLAWLTWIFVAFCPLYVAYQLGAAKERLGTLDERDPWRIADADRGHVLTSQHRADADSSGVADPAPSRSSSVFDGESVA